MFCFSPAARREGCRRCEGLNTALQGCWSPPSGRLAGAWVRPVARTTSRNELIGSYVYVHCGALAGAGLGQLAITFLLVNVKVSLVLLVGSLIFTRKTRNSDIGTRSLRTGKTQSHSCWTFAMDQWGQRQVLLCRAHPPAGGCPHRLQHDPRSPTRWGDGEIINQLPRNRGKLRSPKTPATHTHHHRKLSGLTPPFWSLGALCCEQRARAWSELDVERMSSKGSLCKGQSFTRRADVLHSVGHESSGARAGHSVLRAPSCSKHGHEDQ